MTYLVVVGVPPSGKIRNECVAIVVLEEARPTVTFPVLHLIYDALGFLLV
jgi:hypothetical protein